MSFDQKLAADRALKRGIAKRPRRVFCEALGRKFTSNKERFGFDADVRDNQTHNKCPFGKPHSVDGSLMYWAYQLDVAEMVDADVEEGNYVPQRRPDRNAAAPLPKVAASV